MASPTVRDSYPYLVVLGETIKDLELRKQLLRYKKVLDSLSELTLNLLEQNILLTEAEKKKLKKFRKELLQLSKKYNHQRKYQILTGQQGSGLLTTILSIGLPVLASMLFNKKK